MAYRVFLSSTSKDLAAYRKAVKRAILGLDGFAPIAMENFGARDTDARGIDEEKLGEADVLVGLLGHCYGSSPPDDPTSFTEQEYDFAVGREPPLPRLMFVAPDDFPVPYHLIEPDDKRERQKAFRALVMVERVVASFKSPDDLATGVTAALANWRVKRITEELVAAKEAAAKEAARAANQQEEAARAAARAAELERALAAGQKERETLLAAVQALADRAKAPDAPPQIEQALALLPEGRTAEAKAVFAEIVKRKAEEGERKQAEGARQQAEGAADLREAAEAARHLAALTFLDSTQKAIEAYETATRLDPEDVWSWILLGRLHLQAGSLTAAEQAFEQARPTAERAGNERDAMVIYNELGNVQRERGELPAAHKSYGSGMIIAGRLAATDPDNALWQHDLAVSHNRIGDVLMAQGKLGPALDSYRASHGALERLAAQDPGNAGWQRDLAVSFERIGDVQVARGDLDGALQAYRDSHAIAAKLAAKDPGNAGWQRDPTSSPGRARSFAVNVLATSSSHPEPGP